MPFQDIENSKSADEIFVEFDKDLSGYIDKTELKEALLAASVKVSQEQIDILVSHIDTDGDGKVSKAEFRAFVGVNAALSTQDVVEKMQRSWQQQLRAASSPLDVASIVLNQGSPNNDTAPAQSGCGSLVFRFGCICFVLLVVFGQLAALIYGVIVGSKYSDSSGNFKGHDEEKCLAGGIWVLVLSLVSLFNVTILSSFEKFVKETDPTMESCSGKLVTNFKKLIHMFLFFWLIYGCEIFYTASVQADCEKEMWNFVSYCFHVLFFLILPFPLHVFMRSLFLYFL